MEKAAYNFVHSLFQRSRRDSNPRAPEGKRISSAPRYDRFDTTPYCQYNNNIGIQNCKKICYEK